jgi:hypothetical protein
MPREAPITRAVFPKSVAMVCFLSLESGRMRSLSGFSSVVLAAPSLRT